MSTAVQVVRICFSKASIERVYDFFTMLKINPKSL